MFDKKFHCPRRLDYVPISQWPNDMHMERHSRQDKWQSRNSMVYDTEWSSPSCSYCGSMNPEKLLELLRAGGHIGGSDKGYKWYIHAPMTDEDRERFEQNKAHGHYGKDGQHAWMYEHGQGVGKFYTVHLNRAQANEILDMWEAGTLSHSMYVRPYLPALNVNAPEWLINQ